VAADRLGLHKSALAKRYPRYADIPFESERRYAASVRERDGQYVVFVKGAPERVLAMCSRSAMEEGEAELDAEQVMRAAEELAQDGLRVLAMAYAVVSRPVEDAQELEDALHLVFLGLQGMMDPPRQGVREAIEGCHEAGIRAIMITGDHATTAGVIGQRLGMSARGDRVLSGGEVERLDDAALVEEVAKVSIYARMAPEHKLRVVRAFQTRGEVVAVTGDGVNDAPALKAADIGIAMGESGTDVAREAADMVLADDNFVSIYAAVEEGRVTFDNVRKVTFFLVSTGAAAITTIFVALILRWPMPFVPAQLLWLNLVTKGLQDLALAFEPGEKGTLQRPPRPLKEGIISALLWERTLVTAVVLTVGTLLLFRWELDQTGSLAKAQTVALTTMVLFQTFHLGNSRSDTESVFRTPLLSNRFLLAAAIGALVVHTASLYLSPTQFVLRVEPIELAAWPRMLAVSVFIVVAVELHKLIRRPRGSRRRPLRRSSMRATR
jgi:Ca2+-transporting ATPase